MQGGRKGKRLIGADDQHVVQLLAMNRLLPEICWPFEITLYSNTYQSSLSNVNRLRIDPICPKLAEWERESSIFSIFKKRREELEQKRQNITAQWHLSVGKVAGANPRTFSAKEPEFSVGDIVSIATYRRGALRRMRWALGLDNQGKRVQQLSCNMKQSWRTLKEPCRCYWGQKRKCEYESLIIS